jgi:hypothetical protein
MKFILKTRRAHQICYLCFYCYDWPWVNTNVGGLLVPDISIAQKSRVSAFSWFIEIYLLLKCTAP